MLLQVWLGEAGASRCSNSGSSALLQLWACPSISLTLGIPCGATVRIQEAHVTTLVGSMATTQHRGQRDLAFDDSSWVVASETVLSGNGLL